MPILVIFQSNFADEFDCEGFFIVRDKTIADIEENVKAYVEDNEGDELYFGTNEFIDGEDLLGAFEYKEIDEEFASKIEEAFNGLRYGFGTFPPSIIDIVRGAKPR